MPFPMYSDRIAIFIIGAFGEGDADLIRALLADDYEQKTRLQLISLANVSDVTFEECRDAFTQKKGFDRLLQSLRLAENFDQCQSLIPDSAHNIWMMKFIIAKMAQVLKDKEEAKEHKASLS